MEEELSTVSSSTTLSTKTLNANHPNNHLHHSTGIRVSRFKGVWKQKNGHWGAQMYVGERIWLGTFRSETEAAMAYDSASIKLRNGDSHRNFPWNNITIQEPNFQKQFSTEVVLDMIKDHSYPLKFTDFLRKNPKCGNNTSIILDAKHVNRRFSCTELFRKELTPSDVGKLNRLVIPKKCAVRHFPSFSKDAKENIGNGEKDVLLLEFFDTSNKSWQFRYCYWKSSQSFVFTRGWNRFVKEKKLKENDEVIFYMCESLEVSRDIKMYYIIDISYDNRLSCNGLIRGKLERDIEQENGDCVKEEDPEGEIVLQLGQSEVKSKSIKIFGVEMFEQITP